MPRLELVEVFQTQTAELTRALAERQSAGAKASPQVSGGKPAGKGRE